MKQENQELKIDVDQLRESTNEELLAVIDEMRARHREIVRQSLMDNRVVFAKPHQVKMIRRQIARCETILNERRFKRG